MEVRLPAESVSVPLIVQVLPDPEPASVRDDVAPSPAITLLDSAAWEGKGPMSRANVVNVANMDSFFNLLPSIQLSEVSSGVEKGLRNLGFTERPDLLFGNSPSQNYCLLTKR